MKRIQVKCRGISPLLMNKPPEGLLEEIRTKVTKPRPPDRTPEEEAEEKIHVEDGKIGIPCEMLFRCLVEAGRSVRFNARRNISTKESTLLPSFLRIEGAFFPLFDGKPKWEVDIRPARTDSGSMVPAVRPRFDKWEFAVTLGINEQKIAEERVKELVEEAGVAVGLGSYNPAHRGPFGQFEIAEWENDGDTE